MATQRKVLKKIVQKQFARLKDNLQVKGILAELFSACIIESDLKIKLQEVSVPEEAADKFLDDLYRRVDEAKFHSFVRILTESGDTYPNHLEMAELLQQSLQETNAAPNGQNPMTCLPNGPTLQLPTVNSTDEASTQQSTSVLETSAPSSASTIGTAPNFPVDAKTVPGIDSTPQTSASLIYSPEDKEPEVTQEPEQSCALDSYEHPGKDLPESDDSEEDLQEDEMEVNPSVQSIDTSEISDGDKDVNQWSDPFSRSDSEPKLHDKATNLTDSESDVVLPTNEPKTFSSEYDSRLKTNSESVALVCSRCYETLLSLQKEDTCTDPSHKKECFVRGNRGFTRVRERTAASIDVLCRYLPNCGHQNMCRYSHSEEELDSWKGFTKTYTVCPTCQWTRCCDLMQVQCYDKVADASCLKIVVYKDSEWRQLLDIRFPSNVERMKDKKYFCNHSLNECKEKRKSDCKFPHHKIEEVIWNIWKDKYYVAYMRSRAMRKPEAFFEEVKECLKELPTFSDVLTMPHSPKKESSPQHVKIPNGHKHVAAGVRNIDVHLLEAPLSNVNYKNKFSVLISAEESVHEEKLSGCNSQYDLIFYNQGDIDPRHHEWYACIVMEQILADKLRQAATHVDIHFRNYKIRAQILHPKRYIRRNEACLLVGFNQIGRTHPPKLNVTVANFQRELMYNDLKIYAYFVLKHSYFQNLRKAVGLLSAPIVGKLVPSEAFVLSEKRKWINCTPATHAVDRLQWELSDQFQLDNRHQLKTCKKLLSCPPSLPFIITGPFGTGKTRVLAASAFRVLQVDRNSRVLIAAYQKRTADEYLQKYFTESVIRDLQIHAVRVLGDNVNDSKCPFVKKPWMLQPGDLQKYRLIVTTFVTSMHMKDPGQFTHIFIDEGAQTREPECVAALRYASPDTKIVIAGDHRQVGPQTSVLGEKARNYGLSKSLLERLHSLYNDPNGCLSEFSRMYQSVLLTNWRCHSNILQLPSTLFYGSTIKSNATDSPHPDWKYPLQFVITSLEMGVECKWIKDGELQGAVRAEMEAVKQLVQQCADNWPTGEWGEKDLSLICVMTPTRSSERLWRSTVRNTELANVTVSVTYDIQGLEYRAVFLCTSEPVIDDFKPFDPVKSLCDPRVFNTIITRSQSLVIAFGNPFRPMKIEEQMPEGDKQCWLSYFQRCWENNSIAISNSLNRSHIEHSTALSELEGILLKAKLDYLNNLPKLLKEPPPVDTFEIAYSKIYDAEEMEEEDQSPSKESSHGWKYDQDISSNFPIELQLDKNNARVCKIIEVDADYCIATPVNSSGPSLGIVGPDNRRCALNGATVLVQPRDAGQGAVVAIHSQGDVNPVLCKVDPALPDYFLPVNDKKVKLLNVEDSQKLLKHHLSSEDLVNYHMQRKGYMVCFDPRTVLRRRRITHSIPMDAAGRFLFVVQPLSWDVKERYPRGAAIAIMPKGTTLPLAESLLQIAHQDGFQEDLDPSIQKDAKDRNSLFKFVPQSMPAPDGGFCSSAIGILESDDFSICAFSVERRQDCFGIKVHIANLVENMELLEQGHKKDLSVSKNSFVQGPPARGGVEGDVNGGGSIKPNAITLEFNLEITLKENTTILSQVQDKGTLVGQTDKGTLVRQAGNTVDITNLKIGFSESFVSCNYVLSISDLDDMLRGVISGPASHKKISKKLTLHDQIAILYIVARDLHRRRLGHDGYSLFEATSTEYPEVHELFKEFLIQFNHEAAVKLKDSFPDRALLRRVNPQPGRERKLKSIQEDILQIHTYSDMSTSSSSTSKDLLLFPSVVSEVIESLKHLDGVRVKESLCQLYRHPQYIFLLSRLREFLSAEELCVLDNSIAVHSEVAEHYVHKLPLYTSLTSPHQCVADLYVQEGLLAALRETEWKRSAEELMTVAKQSNKAKSKVRFKCLQRNLLLASSAQQSSICVRAIVQKSQEGSPRYCYFQPDSTTADVSQVESFFMPERSTSVRMRVLSSQGLPLQSFKQVVDSSSNLPSFGFFVAEEDCSGFSRVLVTGVSPPSTLRLSKPTLRNLNECIHSTADSRRLIEKLERMLTPGDQQKSPPSILFTALEGPFPTVTDISFHVVRLWLGCDPMSHVLSVQPQCMELASGVKVCLQHRRDPLSCFTQHPTEKASKLLYNSIDEYRALWSKAILAVSAEHAVNSCTSSLVYKDVVLKFSKFIIPPKILTPEMYVPVGEITAMFKENCVTFASRLYTIGEGDLVCVRYEVDLNQESLRDLLEKYRKHIHPTTCTVARAVLHMVVKKVTRLDKATQVSFEVAGTQPSVSPLMKEILQKNQFSCEIEVISMSPTLRKPYRLLQGSTVRQGLPFDIAMGVFHKILRHTGRGKGLPRKQPVFVSSMSIADRDILESAMKNPLQLIQAVPGTGGEMIANALVCSFALSNKEQRSVEYAQGRSLQKCVLYCFPNEKMAHQAASALFKLLEVSKCTSDGIRVLYINRERERRVHYDEDHIIFDERPPNYDSGDDSDSKEYALHSLLRTSSSATRINEMERKLNDCCQKKMIPAIKDQSTYASLLLKAEGEIIGRRSFDIVVCTASEASSERIRRYFQPVQVVVYNASMITEPETFSAIHQASHVVLIGDHHQHRPLLSSDVSVQNGMNVSLYERLYKLIERENDGDVNKCPLFTHLKEQRDMLPPICELVSHLFYKNQLQSSKNLTFKQDHPLQSFWPNGFPVVLCNMVPAVGRKESLIVDDNTTDNVEIQKTIQVVGALQSCMTDNATSVVVITYSTAQKLHMERLLNSSQPQCHKAPGTVPVLTVDECIAQDRRYDVVILSTVTSELNMHSVKAINSGETIRKQGLETLGDPNRLCAAISTSRQGLIILGNADLLSMKTLTNSEVWEGLVLYCQTKRCILGRDEFPLSKPIPSEALQKSTLPSASKSSSSNVAERRPSPPPPVRQPVSSATPRKKGKKGKGKK